MAAETPTVANVVSLQISLPQMLDLALGSPEVGVVNFNILHNFLHVLLEQINLQSTKVEYRGENADRVKAMVHSLRLGPPLYLQEHNITDGTGKVSERIREDIDVKIFTEDIQSPTEEDLKVKAVKQQIDLGKESEPQTVNGPLPTPLTFKELEQSVKQLQKQFQALEDLSTTPEIVELLKGKNGEPIADVWQFINIKKRLDANEQGIEKLTTMVQDVIKGDITTADKSSINTRLDKLEEKVVKMEQKLNDLQTIASILLEEISPTADNHVTAAETAEIDEDAVPLSEKEETTEIAETADKVSKPVRKIPKTTVDKVAARLDLDNIAGIRQDVAILKEDVAKMQQELQDLNEKIAQSEIFAKTVVDHPVVQEKAAVTEVDKERIVEVSDTANLEQCLEAVKNVETTYGKIMDDITQRMIVLEKEIEHLSEKVEDVMQATDKGDDININELVTKIQGIEADMERIGETVDRLFDDKEKKETDINTLMEQIELLKTVKADKEDIEDALADKADAQTVNRKVSHDQFDAACDDLSRGLEEAIDKLTKQESIWQQALDEVQNEIAAKVDKIEMTPLKDFVTKKLKLLQEKLKIMAEARREIEAAGTKKLLRDVQCISCDKDVVMKTEEAGRFRGEPLPCTISMKPYLTYQLDQVRKQQRKLPHSRNMIQFEAAMQEETKKIKVKEEMLAKTPRDHLINRYCGGSHTIVTPQQKVTRVEHFLTQWGPQTVQLTDGLIKGKDGKMYRSRLLPDKLDVCGPACWESQISEETQSSVSQERAPASTSLRKSSPVQRNNIGNERRNARKPSKEPRIFEHAEKPLAQIVEASQMTPPQNNVDERPVFIPAGLQEEIVLYENSEALKGE